MNVKRVEDREERTVRIIETVKEFMENWSTGGGDGDDDGDSGAFTLPPHW